MIRKTLNISSSPHLVKGASTDVIMKNVVYALLPVAAFAIYAFGINALLVISTSTASCVLTEHLLCRWSKKETTVSDWSAIITGLLLGLTLPPIFPLWMTFFGGVIAIALGKYIFGGLGYNVFNPALVSRAVLQAAFPVAMTTWYPVFLEDRFTVISSSVLTFPLMAPKVDALSGATPLAAFKFDKLATETADLVLGLTNGSTGENCAVLIILGGFYLIVRGMMNWRIPVAILTTVYLLSWGLQLIDPVSYAPPIHMIFSGGLMLGSFFMATDLVGSPLMPKGILVYGVFIGILVVVIRTWGGLPEGVMYAILLGNAISPHLDKIFKLRVYGTTKKYIM